MYSLKKKKGENKKMKKNSKVPHTYVILTAIIIISVFLTWIIPAGQFQRVKDIQTGQNIIQAGTYKVIENNPVNLLSVPLKIVQGMKKSMDIILLVLIVGGAFEVIIHTGVFQVYTSKLTKKFSNKGIIIIPIFTTIFALVCTTQGVNTFIGFAPIGIMVARSLGYDAIVGVAMIALGGAIGFSTGTLNPFTTGVAQSLAGLPLFSGIEYRFFSLVVFLIVTNIYIMKYAKKVKANPELSCVRDLELAEKHLNVSSFEELPQVQKKHFFVLMVVILSFSVLIYGSTKLGWENTENSALFIWMAVLSGLVYGLAPSKIAAEFISGAKKIVFGALIVGFGSAISIVLLEGKILDTIVIYLTSALSMLPKWLEPGGMLIMQTVINGVITSGSGQAAVTMPIMLPVADIINMSRQTAILAFNFGDGFSNYVLPTSSALMGFLAMANITYDNWMKFIWKLFLLWLLTGAILVTIASIIKLGPF